MRKTIQRLKNERGLTLVELLAVIVILAIIAVIAFVFIGGIIENSKKDAHIANAQQIISAAKLYEATAGDLESVTIESLQTDNYLDQILDPWTKKEYSDLKATVTKVTEDGKRGYQINNFKADNGKCDVTATEAELADQGRELCDEGNPEPGTGG